ncbi:type II 3-dehydroquinate dehydratase [Sediminibacillus halophilus]|uniref:3-dehydroquinate dehydratase n=1 Tax=Sediminibacillus halophilus TaxID=482461 RepID=A0A1G9LKF9_9BACI|nr:type II 3-dehydroquinate dehydratase [Sediminibacillus halophilus]SDL62363.1 3-dehydroquinate dehydratase [Sediminibacillus halophilus]
MKRLLLLNGPNLNRLGKREPSIYGTTTLEDVHAEIKQLTAAYGWELDTFQSNHEGELIDCLQDAEGTYQGIVFNPGAYTHTSIAIRDAISGIDVPVIEVHISNIHQREAFRHHSMLASVCYGQVVGLGTTGYRLATLAFLEENKKG